MSLYKRKDSPHWWVKFSHGGRAIQRSTGTVDKHQAQEYHDKLKASLWEQQRLGIKPRRSWKEAVVRWVAETSEKATHQEDLRKLRWLDPLLGNLMLDEVTLEVIDGVKTEKLKTSGKATVNRYLALVRAILRRARDEWEWIERAPKVKLFKEGPGRERSITPEQVVALLGELPTHQRDVVIFALATGLRQSNVLGLGWACVDLAAGHAWVSADQSKNRKPIAVPLNATALEVLRRQLGKHPEQVFTRAGQPLGHANTLAWRKALKRAGISNFSLSRLASYVGLLASAVRYANARVAATRRLALVHDGRTLCASSARPSRTRGPQARFAARWLRFGYARKGRELAVI
jgi:integrase